MPIYKVTGYVMTPEAAMTRYIEADDPKESVQGALRRGLDTGQCHRRRNALR